MLFSALSHEVRAELVKSAPARSYAEGQIIQQRGESARGFYLIDMGSVAVGQFLPDGEFRGVALLGPGDSWGELALFADRPRVVDAVARDSALVRFISAAEFEAAIGPRPADMRAMLGVLSAQLQEVLEVIAGIRRGSANGRVAGLLATMSGTGELPQRVTITQQELGELLGLTRATINLALRHFEHEGAIRRLYGGIEILSREALQMAAMD